MRTSVHNLPPEERKAEYEAAAERALNAARERAAIIKSVKKDPRSAFDYMSWHKCGYVCVLVVKHRDKANSIECSRDGSHYPPTYISNRMRIEQPESTSLFKLLIVPKWLATKSDLVGATLPLAATHYWTDEQQADWERLRKLRLSINTKIHWARRRPSLLLNRAEVA